MAGCPSSDNFGVTPLGEGGAPAMNGAYNNNNNYAPQQVPAQTGMGYNCASTSYVAPQAGGGSVQYGAVTAESALSAAAPVAPLPSTMPSYGAPQNYNNTPARPAVPVYTGATPDLSPAQLERNKRACPQCRGAGCELCAWGYRDTTTLCRQCRGSGCASCRHTGQATTWGNAQPTQTRPQTGCGGGGCCHCHGHGCQGGCRYNNYPPPRCTPTPSCTSSRPV